MNYKKYFNKNGCIYGFCFVSLWQYHPQNYMIKFDKLEDAEKWLNSQERPNTTRFLLSKTKAVEYLKDYGVYDKEKVERIINPKIGLLEYLKNLEYTKDIIINRIIFLKNQIEYALEKEHTITEAKKLLQEFEKLLKIYDKEIELIQKRLKGL